jgi:ribosomal protein S18 acetylase RimI-like enzyme
MAGTSSARPSVTTSSVQPSITTAFAQQRLRVAAEDAAVATLRAAVIDMGLRLICVTGGALSAGEAAELLALARGNIERFVSHWDARERSSELAHSATRLLILRSNEVATAAASTSNAAVSSATTDGHRRMSRRLSALDASPSKSAEACGQGTLAGFASFRFVVQETLPVLYLLELQLDERWRRRGLGSLLLEAVEGIGRAARRPCHGLLLTVHLSNAAARRFYRAKGLEESPVSPSLCAPAPLAALCEHEVLQRLWNEDARATMKARGALAQRKLLGSCAEVAQRKLLDLEASRAAKATDGAMTAAGSTDGGGSGVGAGVSGSGVGARSRDPLPSEASIGKHRQSDSIIGSHRPSEARSRDPRRLHGLGRLLLSHGAGRGAGQDGDGGVVVGGVVGSGGSGGATGDGVSGVAAPLLLTANRSLLPLKKEHAVGPSLELWRRKRKSEESSHFALN